MQLLESAIANDECLERQKGSTVTRNSCRAPWQNRLDLRIAQRIPVGEFDIRVEADLINVLNLLNEDWGQLRVTPSTVALLEATERRESETFGGVDGDLLARWGGGVLPLRTSDGQLRAADPWVTATPDSQWQAQLGFRVQWR